MGKMNVSVATVELSDGTVHENIRCTLQDRLRLERTARAQKWDLGSANHAPSINAFLAFAACTRLGLVDCSYEEFIGGRCTDLQVSQAEAELGDPTQAEATSA